MLSSKQQVVFVIVFISWTISNQILDIKITQAIGRLKDINNIRKTKVDPADSKVSKEVTWNVLEMLKLPRKVVLKKPKEKMTMNQRIQRYGRKVLKNQKVQMKEPRIQKFESSSRIDMKSKYAKNSDKDKDDKAPKDIISIPSTVMSSGIRAIVRTLARLVTVDRETNSSQVPWGPRCILQCLRRGKLHPAQCHQLC